MTTIKNEKVICFDVDDTLIMWGQPDHDDSICVVDPNDGSNNFVLPHGFHINLLKKHKGRDYTIIVWSQGGAAWARAVLKELALENYVDLVMTKPLKYVDDLKVEEWMGQHLYFKDLDREQKKQN